MPVNKQVWGAGSVGANDITRVDREFLKRLRQLCHPDKHADSRLSKVVWERLEEIRKALDMIPGK